MFASYFSKNQMFSQFQHLWLFVEIFMDRYSFFFGYFGLFAGFGATFKDPIEKPARLLLAWHILLV